MIKKIFLLFVLEIFVFAKGADTKEYNLYINGLQKLDKDELYEVLGASDKGFFNSEKLIKEEFVKLLNESAKSFMENRGYFDSKIDINKYENNITISIDENEPVKVTDISIKSNIDVNKIINWKKGDIFAPKRFNEIKDKIITKLLEEGYCQYKLNSKAYVDLKLKSAKLKYEIDKNKVCYFGKIDLEHIPKGIKKGVVYSRIKYKKGDKFDIRAIKDSYANLNKLNTFANIKIAYDLEHNSTTIDTKVSLDKRDKLRRYSVALGVDSVIGPRLKALWQKRNFLGNAKRITLKTELSKRVQSFEATLFTPAFFTLGGYYFDSYLSIGIENHKQTGYKSRKFYIDGHLDYNAKNWNFKAGLGLENLKIDLFENYPGKIGGTFNLLYPYFKLTYDGRDSKIDPKNGIYGSAYLEYGIAGSKGRVQYLKYLLEARAIKSFDDLTLSIVGKIGAIHEVSGKLPASKLFYGGGVFSNRAYGRDKIGIITSKKDYRALGGKSFVNLQLEANYKLYKNIYGAIFFDSTIINEQEYKFKGDRIDTVGFGIRYKTPIGPVKIDVGFNLHNRKDYAISVMLGQSF